ncbi:MAG: phosphopantetheine-binding protein, partial [Candidatus Binatia bacterium]
RQKLPDYMVPSAFVFLDSLPLTPNGKVDRRALPAPDPNGREREETFVAPRTPTEETLARIWSQLLGAERVGVFDNFFDLGGHSLLATQVISRIREAFSMELPLRTLFESPTVGGLAGVIQKARENGAESPASKISPLSRQLHRTKLPL